MTLIPSCGGLFKSRHSSVSAGRASWFWILNSPPSPPGSGPPVGRHITLLLKGPRATSPGARAFAHLGLAQRRDDASAAALLDDDQRFQPLFLGGRQAQRDRLAPPAAEAHELAHAVADADRLAAVVAL